LSVRGLLYTAQGALRAPWRLLIFFLVFAAIAFVLLGLATPVLASPTSLTTQTLYACLIAIALIAAHFICVRLVDRRGMELVRLHAEAARPAPVVGGLVLGALAIGVPSLLLLGVGWFDVRRAPEGSSIVAAGALAALLIPAALYEELLLRGYPFAVLREAWGWKWAIVVTSVIFGLLHIGNREAMADPGAVWQGVVVVVLAGVFLGAVLVATESLYAAWAAHFAWNFVLAALLHADVSGLPLPAPDYRVVDAGPDWATGGGWGPEGGLGATLGMTGALAFLYLRRLRRPSDARPAGREENDA
jgi:membrane protease YdiL (CAAX protease family)